MTHEPPRSEHLDLAQLADLDEDLLVPAETAAAEEHLAGCEQCRQRRGDIRATQALLSTLPADPMPAEVANRVDAALAALPSTTIVPLSPKRRSWRAHPTMAGLGAAATVAALVGALVVARTSSDHHNAADNGPRTTAGAATNQAQLVLPDATETGTNYTAGNLAATVPGLLQPHGPAVGQAPVSPSPQVAAGGAAPKTGTPSAALAGLRNSPSALEACVRSVEKPGPYVAPLALDFASFEGAPSLLVVLPPLPDAPSGTVGAWFVGPGCGPLDADLLKYREVPTASPSPSPGG